MGSPEKDVGSHYDVLLLALYPLHPLYHIPEVAKRCAVQGQQFFLSTNNDKLLVSSDKSLFCPKIIGKIINCVELIKDELGEISSKYMDRRPVNQTPFDIRL